MTDNTDAKASSQRTSDTSDGRTNYTDAAPTHTSSTSLSKRRRLSPDAPIPPRLPAVCPICSLCLLDGHPPGTTCCESCTRTGGSRHESCPAYVRHLRRNPGLRHARAPMSVHDALDTPPPVPPLYTYCRVCSISLARGAHKPGLLCCDTCGRTGGNRHHDCASHLQHVSRTTPRMPSPVAYAHRLSASTPPVAFSLRLEPQLCTTCSGRILSTYVVVNGFTHCCEECRATSGFAHGHMCRPMQPTASAPVSVPPPPPLPQRSHQPSLPVPPLPTKAAMKPPPPVPWLPPPRHAPTGPPIGNLPTAGMEDVLSATLARTSIDATQLHIATGARADPGSTPSLHTVAFSAQSTDDAAPTRRAPREPSPDSDISN